MTTGTYGLSTHRPPQHRDPPPPHRTDCRRHTGHRHASTAEPRHRARMRHATDTTGKARQNTTGRHTTKEQARQEPRNTGDRDYRTRDAERRTRDSVTGGHRTAHGRETQQETQESAPRDRGGRNGARRATRTKQCGRQTTTQPSENGPATHNQVWGDPVTQNGRDRPLDTTNQHSRDPAVTRPPGGARQPTGAARPGRRLQSAPYTPARTGPTVTPAPRPAEEDTQPPNEQ